MRLNINDKRSPTISFNSPADHNVCRTGVDTMLGRPCIENVTLVLFWKAVLDFGGRKVNKPDIMRVPMAHTNRKGPPNMCCIQGLSLGVLWANSCPKQVTPVHREHWCGVGVICPPRVMYWKFGVQCGNVRGSNTLEKWHPLAPDEVIWLWPLKRFR